MGSKWVAEITEHCQGVKVVLVALKCDLREEQEKDDEGHEENADAPPKQIIQYQEGLEVARKIGALRYLGTLDSPTLANPRGEEIVTDFGTQNAQPCATVA